MRTLSAATIENALHKIQHKWIEYAAANREGLAKVIQKHNKKRNENLIERKIFYGVVKSFQIPQSICSQ